MIEAVPELLMLAGVIVPQVSPVEVESEMEIVPENPFSELNVRLEVSDDPGGKGAGFVALTVKSWKLKMMIVDCTIVPLVPEIVKG